MQLIESEQQDEYNITTLLIRYDNEIQAVQAIVNDDYRHWISIDTVDNILEYFAYNFTNLNYPVYASVSGKVIHDKFHFNHYGIQKIANLSECNFFNTLADNML